MTRQLIAIFLALGIVGPAMAQDRPKIGETVTTESGLIYKFTQLGKGPQPQMRISCTKRWVGFKPRAVTRPRPSRATRPH